VSRSTYGGSIADVVQTQGPGGTLKYAATILSVWSDKTGGTHHTDLLLDDTAVNAIPVATDGQIPAFEGPDGVNDGVWIDAPGATARVLLLPRGGGGGGGGITGPIGITDVEGLSTALGDLAPDPNLTTADAAGVQFTGAEADGEYELVDVDALDPGDFGFGRQSAIIAQNFYASGATGVTNTTTETNVDSLTVHAADVAAHDMLDYEAAGTILNNSGAPRTVTIKVYLGSTLLAQGSQSLAVPSSPAAATDPYRWEVALRIHLAALNDQRVNGTLRYINPANPSAAASVAGLATYAVVREAGSVAEDLSADKAIRVTATLGAANAALTMKASHSKVRRDPGIA
jgi:hypothetical protein